MRIHNINYKMAKFKSDKELFIELGQKLKRIRLLKNLTQKEVAKKTGIDRATVSLIENGRPTTLSYFFKLIRLYDKIDDFMQVFYLPQVSPMEMLELEKKRRKRASGDKLKNKEN